MTRLIILLAPAASALSGVALGSAFELYGFDGMVRSWLGAPLTPTDQQRRRQGGGGAGDLPVPTRIALTVLMGAAVFVGFRSFHAHW